MSTIDAESAKSIRDEITGTGAEYLEAPVSGSKQPAEQGTLVILAAGDKALFERAKPLFEVMGKASFYLGQVSMHLAHLATCRCIVQSKSLYYSVVALQPSSDCLCSILPGMPMHASSPLAMRC